jgi:hypothetical protein
MRVCAHFRLLVAAASVVAVSLLFPLGVSAHRGAPFWSEREARDRVLLGPINMNSRAVRLEDALCIGAGNLRIRSGKVLKYQHFKCLLTPARDRRFWIYVHTLKGGWTYTFLRWS